MQAVRMLCRGYLESFTVVLLVSQCCWRRLTAKIKMAWAHGRKPVTGTAGRWCGLMRRPTRSWAVIPWGRVTSSRRQRT